MVEAAGRPRATAPVAEPRRRTLVPRASRPLRAMLLAAGRGERMRPLTDTVPKPLLVAGGKPLIVWHLERLAAIGVNDVVINHAWLGERIEATLGDGSALGLRIRYSPETEALETAGGIAQALPLLIEDSATADRDDRPFLVISADVFTDFDLGRASTIALQMDAGGHGCWCVMVRNPAHHGGGDFRLDGGRLGLAATVAQPAPGPAPTLHGPTAAEATAAEATAAGATGQDGATLTYAGVGLFRPGLFREITPGTKQALRPLLEREIAAGRAAGERHDGEWFDIGTPQRLQELDRRLRARTANRPEGE